MERLIGIRDAKARLSEVVRAVRHGTTWVVTDRGRPVAKIGPADDAPLSLNDRLADLERRGLIRRGNPDAPLPPAVKVKRQGVAQAMLREGRDARG